MFSMAKDIVTIKIRNEHIASKKFCLSSVGAWLVLKLNAEEEIARNLKLKITFAVLMLNGPLNRSSFKTHWYYIKWQSIN